MNEQRANLAIVQHTDPPRGWWLKTREMAKEAITTGFLPKAIQTPEQALMVMLKGYELGLPRTYALGNIVIVNGKPTISAEALLALVCRDYGKGAFRVKESTNESCTVEWHLDGWEGTSSYTFTKEDAIKAGLWSLDTWKKYPAAMLRARAISAGVRMSYPECGAGMYVPGELGEPVIVTDDGVVISAAAADRADTRADPIIIEAESRTQEEKQGVSLLHEALASRGLYDREELHQAAHLVGTFFFPEIDSLTDLTADMTTDLAATVADADEGELALWATDWEHEIKEAATMEELLAIARTFAQLRITQQTHSILAHAWQDRKNALEAEAAHKTQAA